MQNLHQINADCLINLIDCALEIEQVNGGCSVMNVENGKEANAETVISSKVLASLVSTIQ